MLKMQSATSTFLCSLLLTQRLVDNDGVKSHADVAELADAGDSGSSARKGVEVRILSSALHETGVPVSRWKLLFFLSVLTTK